MWKDFVKLIETKRLYLPKGIEKSYVRGYAHKLMLCMSPFWLWLTWAGWSACHLFHYLASSITLCAMFFTSTMYHHFEHTPESYEFWRKIDMCTVAIAAFANTLPALLYFQLYKCIILYLIIGLCTGGSIWYSDPRRGMIYGMTACLVHTLICVIPPILQRIPPNEAITLISHLLTVFTAIMCYTFPDNDSPVHGKRPILAMHDILHFITLSFALNFMYFNNLITHYSCSPVS